MNWDDTPPAHRPPVGASQRGPLDYCLWALIALLTVAAILRYTIWFPKAEQEKFDLKTMSHLANYFSDIEVREGNLHVQQTAIVDSHAQEGFRGLTTYMPRSIDPGIEFRYDIELAMRGDRVISLDKTEAVGGDLVNARGVELLMPGKHTFTLVYTVKNAITTQGDSFFIRWPASSLWRTPVAFQDYRWYFPATLDLKEAPQVRVLIQPNLSAKLEEFIEPDPKELSITSEKDVTGLHYHMTLSRVLMPGEQTFIEARWPLSDLAINQKRALETKPQWETENVANPVASTMK